MKRIPFIAYSLGFSALNLVFGIVLCPLAREARVVFDRIASNTNTLLPSVTTAALAAIPLFYALAFVFFGLGVVTIIRPTLPSLRVDALMATLIATVGTLFAALGGLLYYVVRLSGAIGSTA